MHRDTPTAVRAWPAVVARFRGENVSVHIRPAVRGLSVSAALLLVAGMAACGGTAPDQPGPVVTDSFPPDPSDSARTALAARAALAQDHRFAALYHFDPGNAPQRNVVATVAGDGSWRVDIAGGALGGSADVSIVSNAEGVFQCSLPSATNPVTSTCVRVANPGKAVPKAYDPKVERLFRQWLSVFTDRQSALSVSTGAPLPGAQGTCFSVDSISASLPAPVDIGIYCYADNGLLTAARVGFGELTLASAPVTPPAKVDLPGPVTPGPALGTASPSPDPSIDASLPPVASVPPPA
jgi:hypothetical protein